MSISIERRIAWSWILGGGSIAFALATLTSQRILRRVVEEVLKVRPPLGVDGRFTAEALVTAMQGLWVMAVSALVIAAAGFFLALPRHRARWLAVASVILACVALWMQRAFTQSASGYSP